MVNFLKKRIWLYTSILLLITLIVGLGINVSDKPNHDDGFTIGNEQSSITFTIGNPVYASGTPDYVCDGTADDIQFQQAMNALPATGGRLVVLGGTYQFTATVTRVINNITIEGVGTGTVINNNGVVDLFAIGGTNWVIRDLKVDAGGITSYTTATLTNVTIGVDFIAYQTPSTSTASDFLVPVGRTATYVIAASDATAIEKAQADYVCVATSVSDVAGMTTDSSVINAKAAELRTLDNQAVMYFSVGKIYANDCLDFSKISVYCAGYLWFPSDYTGIAVKAGGQAKLSYHFKSIRRDAISTTIGDIGLKVFNISHSNVTIQESYNFYEGLVVSADSSEVKTGSTYHVWDTKFYIGSVIAYMNCIHMTNVDATDWVNDNQFFGGSVTPLNATGIGFLVDGTYLHHDNTVNSIDFEQTGATQRGIKVTFGAKNYFLGIRNEGLTYLAEFSADGENNIVTCVNQNPTIIDTSNHRNNLASWVGSQGKVLLHSANVNQAFKYDNSIRAPGLSYRHYYYTNPVSLSMSVHDDELVKILNGGQYINLDAHSAYGVRVDTSVTKKLWVHPLMYSTDKAILLMIAFDANNAILTGGSDIVGGGWTSTYINWSASGYGGRYFSNSPSDEAIQVTVSDDTKSVWIGVSGPGKFCGFNIYAWIPEPRTKLPRVWEDCGNYVAPGENKNYAGSLKIGTVGNAVIAWQNPEAQSMMVTGRTRITTGATAASTGDWGLATTVQVVEDCEDSWTDGVHGTAAVNTTYVERGTNCNAITITAGITNSDIVAYEDFAGKDISTATHLLFKFRSSVALNAADIAILLDEDAACASPSFTLNLPAIAANTTTTICLPINAGAAGGATVDALISVGLQVLNNTRAVVGTILYIDDIRAITVGTDLVNDANLQTLGIANYATPIHLDYKNNDDATHHDTLVMVSAANDSTGLVGSYYVNGQGE